MLVPLVRMVADWLASGNAGADSVGAMLATVPREAGDALPATPAIDDMTRDGWVARLRATEDGGTYPCLAVWVDQPLEMDAPTADPNTPVTVQVTVGYIARGELTQDEVRTGDYTVRAAARSIARLNRETAAAVAARQRGEMVLEAITAVGYRPPMAMTEIGDVWATGSVVLTAKIRETKPEG